MATTGTNSHQDKEVEPTPSIPDGYHERNRNESGLHLDSTEALFSTPMARKSAWRSMKRETLEVVARDGIEPPTPAFSGLHDQSLTDEFLVVS
jgi:hypothetical protein